MHAKVLVTLGLMCMSGLVGAQNCGGMVAVNGVCIPPDSPTSPLNSTYGQQPGQSAAPQMKWADRWGAIAIDDTNSSVGAVVGMPSKQDAEKLAMEQCRSKGGGGCRVEVAYDNQCGVIACGDNYYVAANSVTIAEASEMAVKSCSQHTSNCRIYYADCSMAERVQ